MDTFRVHCFFAVLFYSLSPSSSSMTLAWCRFMASIPFTRLAIEPWGLPSEGNSLNVTLDCLLEFQPSFDVTDFEFSLPDRRLLYMSVPSCDKNTTIRICSISFGKILLRNIKAADRGEYSCRGVTSLGVGPWSEKLDLVLRSVPSVKLVLDPPGPANEAEHFNVTLNCQIETGDSEDVFRYRFHLPDDSRQYVPVPSCDNNTSIPTCSINPGKILLRNIKRADHGEYACRAEASTGMGPWSPKIELVVYSAPSPETSISETPRTTSNTTLAEKDIGHNASIYYTTKVFAGPKVEEGTQVIIDWVEMDTHKYLKTDQWLSPSLETRTVDKQLSFDFPFFGEPTRNVTISTRGLLYIGKLDDVESTQYVAPLNCDFISTHNSSILFGDNGTAFTARWDSVYMQGMPSLPSFSFEVTLINNGAIIFIYKDIPVRLDDLTSDGYLVNVGLSYSPVKKPIVRILNTILAVSWQKHNYTIEVEKTDIRGGTVVLLEPKFPVSPDQNQ